MPDCTPALRKFEKQRIPVQKGFRPSGTADVVEHENGYDPIDGRDGLPYTLLISNQLGGLARQTSRQQRSDRELIVKRFVEVLAAGAVVGVGRVVRR